MKVQVEVAGLIFVTWLRELQNRDFEGENSFLFLPRSPSSIFLRKTRPRGKASSRNRRAGRKIARPTVARGAGANFAEDGAPAGTRPPEISSSGEQEKPSTFLGSAAEVISRDLKYFRRNQFRTSARGERKGKMTPLISRDREGLKWRGLDDSRGRDRISAGNRRLPGPFHRRHVVFGNVRRVPDHP